MRSFIFNEVMKLRRQTLIKMAEMYENNQLEDEIDKLPKIMLPGPEGKYRGSVYHEREVLKNRIKNYLGLDYDKTKDKELYELTPFLDEILSGKSDLKSEKFVQVIKEACDSCPSGRYYVTDLCRNCVAHSCMNACPKNAISFENGRAVIDTEKCIGCGLCSKSCSYFAIVKLERPCERACSVNAVIKDEDNSAKINEEKCVNCGNCYISCPFGAVETPSYLMNVLYSLKNFKNNIAIFAPAIVSQFGPKVSIGQIKDALKKAGFDNAYEVAIGADIVAQEEAELLDNTEELVTTSCCPAFVEYIKKHQHKYIKNISPAPSPMIALAKKVKEENKDSNIIFIGPCIAKKSEAYNSNYIDYVITFEELGALLIAKNIEPTDFENEDIEGSYDAWNFAASGGVTKAVENRMKKENITTLKMNGLEEGKQIFKDLEKENINLLEGMACFGGCISGPGVLINPRVANNGLKKIKTLDKI
ncbi:MULTISPECIES: monomeric [FeFe] hydrogenase [Oceanotoga]|jgi:[FeFe] hydrogenase (group B1/B3)|uniref:[FeFe] hydrogenase (Group B1/B3) n=1 Tax=Oceanotoga teriensis TaxID=515440 RepID=A0AA45C8K2_9BACT|nr:MULTISPECIES: monomeric [FeFe] hydrogenase [Oceanotoga]MDO7975478.1 monomeric [FeFe] hydrogenase [Oceanotoga teriensis]PWJ96234.1 [FeFe] hydrogenase (group B1/B3) [Oceanotoga teriensis]